MPGGKGQLHDLLFATQMIRNIGEQYNPWIAVQDRQPSGAPIVFMYSESNNEFSFGHFTLSRGEVPVTHWMPCKAPSEYFNS